MLSGSPKSDDRVSGLNLGAVDYLAKPFLGAELLARVSKALKFASKMRIATHRAMCDSLTGVWNRAFFDERLLTECHSSARHRRPLSCIMFDVDKFKSINDVHGHQLGDRTIQAVAQTARDICRREDFVCRYGGDEFIVLCPDVVAEQAAVLAERLRRKVGGLTMASRIGTVNPTCSFGVADTRSGLHSALIQAADHALYMAKADGRNRVHILTGLEQFQGGPMLAAA